MTVSVEVPSEATIEDVIKAAGLPRTALLSFGSVRLYPENILADAGIGAESVLDEMTPPKFNRPPDHQEINIEFEGDYKISMIPGLRHENNFAYAAVQGMGQSIKFEILEFNSDKIELKIGIQTSMLQRVKILPEDAPDIVRVFKKGDVVTCEIRNANLMFVSINDNVVLSKLSFNFTNTFDLTDDDLEFYIEANLRSQRFAAADERVPTKIQLIY